MQSGETPLHAAAERGSIEIVTTFLNSGADLHVRNKVRIKILLFLNYILGCVMPKSLKTKIVFVFN